MVLKIYFVFDKLFEKEIQDFLLVLILYLFQHTEISELPHQKLLFFPIKKNIRVIDRNVNGKIL